MSQRGDNVRGQFKKAVTWAAKRAAARAFRATPIGQAISYAQSARAAMSAFSAPKAVVRQINSAVHAQSVRKLAQILRTQSPAQAWRTVEQYALSGEPQYRAVRDLLRGLGPIGSILAAMLPGGGTGRAGLGAAATNNTSLKAALAFIEAFSDRPDVQKELTRILEAQGARVIWPTGEPVNVAQVPGMSPTAPGSPGAPGDAGQGAPGAPPSGFPGSPVPPSIKVGLPASISETLEQIQQAAIEEQRQNQGGATRPGAPSVTGTGTGPGHGGGMSSVPKPSAFPTGTPGTGSTGAADSGQPSSESPRAAPANTVDLVEDGTTHRLPRTHPAVTGDFVETPESSNVHSFGFDWESHTLFVRFKAQAQGEKVRPHRPGPIYSYRNVPIGVFLKMLAAPSKGVFIWDNIRIRGTLSGHKYDYALVGVTGGYVPRKATLTPEGEAFIGRSIFTDASRSLRSSRPDQIVRPLAPLGRAPKSGRGGLSGS